MSIKRFMQVIGLEKKKKRGRELTLRPGLGFGPTQWPGGARYWAGVGLLAAGWRCWASALCWARPSDQGAGARVHGGVCGPLAGSSWT